MIEESGLNEVITDLTRAGLTAGIRAAAILDDVGRDIRDTARQLAPRTGLPHYAAKITHEVVIDKLSVTAIIGAEKGGQGSLGHILEHGTASSPPHAHHGPALDLKAPEAVKRLADIVDPFT